jgi:hypothetical protein
MDTSGMGVEYGWAWTLALGFLIVILGIAVHRRSKPRCWWCKSRKIARISETKFEIYDGVCVVEVETGMYCERCHYFSDIKIKRL